jgi:hypothetical protein
MLKRFMYFMYFALVQDLRRRSALSLFLSAGAIAFSVAICAVLFSFAEQVARAVDDEMIRSGAVNALEVTALEDSEANRPWSAEPIGTSDPTAAINRLVEVLREHFGHESIATLEPLWRAPGFVYVFLTPPDYGGKAVSVGVALTSPLDPESVRVEGEKLAGGWVHDPEKMQIVLPKRVADKLWRDVLFVGESGWLGVSQDNVCAEVEVVGIYRQTQRDYCYVSRATARAIQRALDEDIARRRGEPLPEVGADVLAYDRAWIYFRDRRALLRARRLVEERYKFDARSPFDKFEGKLRLVAAARMGSWAVLFITLGAACGSIFCAFLAWVSRRRYEIALLKAQGSGNAWVAGTYLLQSGVAGLLAGCIGVIFASYLLCPWLSGWVTSAFGVQEPISLHVPGSVAALMVVAAFAATLIAALIPASIAARQDPWDILRDAA